MAKHYILIDDSGNHPTGTRYVEIVLFGALGITSNPEKARRWARRSDAAKWLDQVRRREGWRVVAV